MIRFFFRHMFMQMWLILLGAWFAYWSWVRVFGEAEEEASLLGLILGLGFILYMAVCGVVFGIVGMKLWWMIRYRLFRRFRAKEPS